MRLTDYIATGAEKAGSVAALARELGLVREAVAHAKSEKRPLPLDAAVRLADYLGADRLTVIAANELATEKDEKKRAYWRPFVEHARAAALVAALALVTIFLTPAPAQASPILKLDGRALCIMLRRLREQAHLNRCIKLFKETVITILSFRPAQPQAI